MKKAPAGLLAALFAAAAVAALVPRIRRYGARIDLNRCQRAILVSTSLAPEPRRRLLAAVRDELESVSARLPEDVRPTYLLGTSALLLGEPGEAIEQLRRSLAVEERPETDLNLSRAHADAGDEEASAADALRAVWLSPTLSRELPEDARESVRRQIHSIDRELRSGTASAIPRLAESDAPVGQNDR